MIPLNGRSLYLFINKSRLDRLFFMPMKFLTFLTLKAKVHGIQTPSITMEEPKLFEKAIYEVSFLFPKELHIIWNKELFILSVIPDYTNHVVLILSCKVRSLKNYPVFISTEFLKTIKTKYEYLDPNAVFSYRTVSLDGLVNSTIYDFCRKNLFDTDLYGIPSHIISINNKAPAFYFYAGLLNGRSFANYLVVEDKKTHLTQKHLITTSPKSIFLKRWLLQH